MYMYMYMYSCTFLQLSFRIRPFVSLYRSGIPEYYTLVILVPRYRYHTP
jgi:hypothetical protein